MSPRFSSKPMAAAARVSICFNSSGVRLRRFSVLFLLPAGFDCVIDQQSGRDAADPAYRLQGVADDFVYRVGRVCVLED